VLPTINGPCPTFQAGQGSYSVTLADGGLNDAGAPISMPFTAWTGSSGGGPFVVYWHALGTTGFEATAALGSAVVGQVTLSGGMVVAPETTTQTGKYIGDGDFYGGDVDYLDQILACAISQQHVDTRRIYVVGFDSGAISAIYMWFQRSNYVAGIASYSGGDIISNIGDGGLRDPSNPPPAIVAHGMPGNDVVIVDWTQASQKFEGDVQRLNGFAVDCQDNGAHAAITTRTAIAPQVFQFFLDHPYKVRPEPYAAGPTGPNLPDGGWPSYCKITSVPDGG
jgi:predicted esterase